MDELPDDVQQLERQVERGQLFTHTALSEIFDRAGEMSAFLHGLLDVLLAKGVITEDELAVAATRVRQQMSEEGELQGAGIAVGVSDSNEQPSVEVDCSARLHICQAACCKLNFALSIEEVEAGYVKWDLGKPYFIRHEANGYCTHIHQGTGGCRIYDHRPRVCRRYSCANDARIWNDFDNMVLNTEWLEANLPPERPERWVAALMEPGAVIPLTEITENE